MLKILALAQDKILNMDFRTIIYLPFLLTISCKDKDIAKYEEETVTNSKTMIEDILKKQLLQGANQYKAEVGVEMPKKKFEISDLEVSTNECKEILFSNGFKSLNQVDFENKIFGRKIDFSSDKNYLYVNNLDKCDKEFNYHPFHSVDFNGAYIVKEKRFITDFYFLPEIIDYKKRFPEVSKIEEKVKVNYINDENNEISIELWKDIEDLADQRIKNIQIIVNRNKYLFNDNKASLAWLKFNDLFFLENLVKTFGYVEDQDLSKFILEKSVTNLDEFGKVLWTKDCDDNLKFHTEIWNIIKTLPKEKQQKYLETTYRYFEYLLIDGEVQKKADLNLTFNKKAELLGKLAYYATRTSGLEGRYYFIFFKFLDTEEFRKEFESQKYYNIKDFKELFEETKTGGVGLPE